MLVSDRLKAKLKETDLDKLRSMIDRKKLHSEQRVGRTTGTHSISPSYDSSGNPHQH